MIFDIETAPLQIDELMDMCPPFDKTPYMNPGEFDPSTVKCGNIGGPDSEKGKAKIAEARKAHEDRVANLDKECADAEQAYWMAIKDRAALSPTTGKVVAIGLVVDGDELLLIDSEQVMLFDFWQHVRPQLAKGGDIVGFNSNHFDIPFLIKRSWKLGIEVPACFTPTGFLRQNFVDLLDRWKCGDRGSSPIKLAALASFFGLDGKYQDLDGSLFWQLLEADVETAKEYLRADLRMTSEIYKRMR